VRLIWDNNKKSNDINIIRLFDHSGPFLITADDLVGPIGQEIVEIYELNDICKNGPDQFCRVMFIFIFEAAIMIGVLFYGEK